MATENFTENQVSDSDTDEVLSQEFIDSLFAKGPEITPEDLYKIEENMGGQVFGIARRISLATLSKSIKELCDIGEQSPDAHAEVLKQAELFLEQVKSMLEFAEAAAWRMRFADCHVQAVINGGGQSSH